MIKTDALTGYLLSKFVEQEEEKKPDDTLYLALIEAHQSYLKNHGKETINPGDELPHMVIRAAADTIKEKVVREIHGTIKHLADTLKLAREIGVKSTRAKRRKLKKMAEKAIGFEPTKLALLDNAMSVIDFDHIADTLVRVGMRMRTEQLATTGVSEDSGCA